MNKPVKVARKIGALIIGIPLLVLGIILIPLPGPGLVVSALGLLVLSYEFDWARRHLESVKAQIKKINSAAHKRADRYSESDSPKDKRK
jgi:uncharacterized protein (TIGR02611 family)